MVPTQRQTGRTAQFEALSIETVYKVRNMKVEPRTQQAALMENTQSYPCATHVGKPCRIVIINGAVVKHAVFLNVGFVDGNQQRQTDTVYAH